MMERKERSLTSFYSRDGQILWMSYGNTRRKEESALKAGVIATLKLAWEEAFALLHDYYSFMNFLGCQHREIKGNQKFLPNFQMTGK